VRKIAGLTKKLIKALGNFGAKTSEVEKVENNVLNRFEYINNGGKSRFLEPFKSLDEFQNTFTTALKNPGKETSIKFLRSAEKEGLFDGTNVVGYYKRTSQRSY